MNKIEASMREIKFRAIRVDNDEWVYGYYMVGLNNWSYIINVRQIDNSSKMNSYTQVKPETVGQFTGLKDKNGVEIYEGDFDFEHDVVTWCENRNGWSLSTYDLPTKDFMFCNCYSCEGNFELEDLENLSVIGNIHKPN